MLIHSKLRALLTLASVIGGPAHSQPAATIGGVANERERGELQRWLDETNAVLRSAQFAANLRSVAGTHRQVFIAGDRGQPRYVADADLAAMFAAGAAWTWFPTAVALSGDGGWFGGLTGFIGTAEADGSEAVSMTLYRGDLARWRSDNEVERSCAVNTLAHELTHTVSTTRGQFTQAVTDYNRFDAVAGAPAVSYLVGTVAQCTWLQQRGRVTTAGLQQCVATFGHRHFNSLRCNQFAAGVPVQPRPGLPAAATDREMDSRPPLPASPNSD